MPVPTTLLDTSLPSASRTSARDVARLDRARVPWPTPRRCAHSRPNPEPDPDPNPDPNPSPNPTPHQVRRAVTKLVVGAALPELKRYMENKYTRA